MAMTWGDLQNLVRHLREAKVGGDVVDTYEKAKESLREVTESRAEVQPADKAALARAVAAGEMTIQQVAERLAEDARQAEVSEVARQVQQLIQRAALGAVKDHAAVLLAKLREELESLAEKSHAPAIAVLEYESQPGRTILYTDADGMQSKVKKEWGELLDLANRAVVLRSVHERLRERRLIEVTRDLDWFDLNYEDNAGARRLHQSRIGHRRTNDHRDSAVREWIDYLGFEPTILAVRDVVIGEPEDVDTDPYVDETGAFHGDPNADAPTVDRIAEADALLQAKTFKPIERDGKVQVRP